MELLKKQKHKIKLIFIVNYNRFLLHMIEKIIKIIYNFIYIIKSVNLNIKFISILKIKKFHFAKELKIEKKNSYFYLKIFIK